LIARGAFGVVRLCHSSSHGLCAVKTIPLPSEEAWQAAQHEARALELASGPNTVKLLGLVRLEPSSQRPIPVGLLLMEYVSGGTLSSLASSWRPTTGRGLPTGLLKRYTRCIVEAVAHVHAQGMAHRDLKGANVLLAPESQSVKLADFGSCKLPAGAAEDLDAGGGSSPGFQSQSTPPRIGFAPDAAASARPVTAISARGVQRTGGGGKEGSGAASRSGPTPSSPRGEVGTIAWMAPEVVKRGVGDAGHSHAGPSAASPSPTSLAFWQAADVWGLGCTVLELLTGHPPWHGRAEEASEIMLCIASTDIRDCLPAWANAEVTSFLRACLHPDPSARPTAAELLYSPFLYSQDFEDNEAAESPIEALSAAAVSLSPSAAGGGGGAGTPSKARGGGTPKVQSPLKRPPFASLLQGLGSLPMSTLASAVASCDTLKSQVRLSCRQAQHWFQGLQGRGDGGSGHSTEWVAQCLFSEERVPLGEYLEGFLGVAANYGPVCAASVTAACATQPVYMHKDCASGILFGQAAEASWTNRVETVVLLGAIAGAAHPGSGGGGAAEAAAAAGGGTRTWASWPSFCTS
jgi:serine/threonine protein kinase